MKKKVKSRSSTIDGYLKFIFLPLLFLSLFLASSCSCGNRLSGLDVDMGSVGRVGENPYDVEDSEDSICGDGILDNDMGEACDDGNIIDGDGCSAQCLTEETEEVIEENQEGNDGDDGEEEPIDISVCGDGTIDGSETCDDGNLEIGDGCSDSCNLETGFSCSGTPSLCTATCGDGTVAGTEQCDDGNIDNGDGCASTCVNEEVVFFDSVCGNHIVESGEECDLANLRGVLTDEHSGCDGTCHIMPGFTCSGNPSICAAICGDGDILGSEWCDDGNTDNGDGCDSYCNIEF